MEKYVVTKPDCGTAVWQGEAQDALDACHRTASSVGVAVGPFLRYEAVHPSQRDDGVNRMVIAVYRSPGVEADDYIGTFAALVHE